MPGVAYTTGTHNEKEIHFSLDYILQSKARAHDEIMGVLVHEVVHCFQHNARGTCPGGLIEGIAGEFDCDSALIFGWKLPLVVAILSPFDNISFHSFTIE